MFSHFVCPGFGDTHDQRVNKRDIIRKIRVINNIKKQNALRGFLYGFGQAQLSFNQSEITFYDDTKVFDSSNDWSSLYYIP